MSRVNNKFRSRCQISISIVISGKIFDLWEKERERFRLSRPRKSRQIEFRSLSIRDINDPARIVRLFCNRFFQRRNFSTPPTGILPLSLSLSPPSSSFRVHIRWDNLSSCVIA